MLLDVVGKIQLFVDVFAGVYTIAVILYVLTSWVRMPYSLQPVQRFLYDVCDPYLRFWRRVLPFAVRPIDFTPIVAIIMIGVMERLIVYVVGRF